MKHWKTIIGHGRERELVDAVWDVLLDLDAGSDYWHLPQPVEYDWFCDVLAEYWLEGYLADAGYTLDDLAGVSRRLGKLSRDQWREMVAAYLKG